MLAGPGGQEMWTVLIAAAIVANTGAALSQAPGTQQCYDAMVRATIVEQTPTAVCDDFCMEWPYIDELDVKQVMRGRAPMGQITVLSMQHNYRRAPRTGSRMWLRRNDTGGYNILKIGNEPKPPLCSNEEKPARPYVRPGAGRTLDDLKREGDQLYGHMSGEAIHYPSTDNSAQP